MDFYYINSNGRKIDLTQSPYIGIKSNDLFEFEWDYITQGQAVQKIVKFEKYMKKKKFQVVITGSTSKEYRENLDKFLQLTDVDINNLKMGRLYIGEYYLECYIFASGKKKRYIDTLKTMVECSIICENGNWQSDEKWSFMGGGTENDEETTGNGILYPYDYMYDYSAPFERNTIINESYLDADFEMIFYGACEVPEVTIGGNDYRINYSINVGEYLVINSREKKVYVTKDSTEAFVPIEQPKETASPKGRGWYEKTENTYFLSDDLHVVEGKTYYERKIIAGEKVNVFMYRDRDWNIFEKIKSGGNLVLLNASTSLDVTLFYERSEPFWGDQKWT